MKIDKEYLKRLIIEELQQEIEDSAGAPKPDAPKKAIGDYTPIRRLMADYFESVRNGDGNERNLQKQLSAKMAAYLESSSEAGGMSNLQRKIFDRDAGRVGVKLNNK